MSNGICEFTWGDNDPFVPTRVYQFMGGAPMLAKVVPQLIADGGYYSAIVVEKFTPRPASANNGFHLTRASAEPLRCEGVLIGLGLEHLIRWGEPSQQYFMGGETLVQKKKRSREFLKRNGLYITGSTVSEADANDAISAELHAISWLRRERHMPTINALFG